MSSTCHHVQPQLIQGIAVSVAESTGCRSVIRHRLELSSRVDSLNPTSREVHESPHRSMICVCSASTSPRWTTHGFDQIYPKDNIIPVSCRRLMVPTLRSNGMREVAVWVLNGTHWFNLSKQPMMIVIWCRDWSDATKFQYLMQIVQVHFEDYAFHGIRSLSSMKMMLTSLFSIGQEPTTIWDGQPVIGFMAET